MARPVSDWDPDAYARHAAFVPALAASLIRWLEPKAGERILDLGCGDGALTARIAAAGADVLGVDASPRFVSAARERGLNAAQVDGMALAFMEEFDAVFSNAALHWMRRDPDVVLQGVSRALRPGGRFVAEMGAAGNVASIHVALREEVAKLGIDPDQADPWYFPEPEEYAARLEWAGFKILRMECFTRPTRLPGDVGQWLTTLARPLLAALPVERRDTFVVAITNRLRPTMQKNDGHWVADYVRLRFSAVAAPAR